MMRRKNGYQIYDKRNKDRLLWKRVVCIWMAGMFMLTGCGKQQKIPELLEPVANNQSFRPVVRGDIGQIDIKIADVVPEEYCYFSKNAMEILDINVDLGQYVEEGQILATVDTAAQQEELDAINGELSLQQTLSANNEKIAEQQIQLLNMQKKECKDKGDKAGVKASEDQIAVEKENVRFEKALASHQERVLQEQIHDLKEDIENGVIRARHSGYVTYVKDMSESNMANGMENIVIVSDYDQLHLELTEDISSSFYKQSMPRYDRMYTNIGGKEYDVKAFTYSNAQLMAIQGAQVWPRIRFEIEGNSTGLQPGDKLLIYFSVNAKKNALKIGTDSLNIENDAYFVYVKTGDGKEKREIQIGYKNELEVEVTEGLSEGEWVFYSSDSLMPSAYETVTVKKQVFGENQEDEALKGVVVYTRIHSYQQNENATVESVNFKKGDLVKKGDLICVLNLETGGAGLKEQQQAIANYQSDYKKQKDELDKQILNLEKQIKRQKKKDKKKEQQPDTTQPLEGEEQQPDTTQPETSETRTEDEENDSAEEESPSVEQLTCEKNILLYQRKNLEAQYAFDVKNMQTQYNTMAETNDGNGKRSVYAKQDGIMGKVNVYEGKLIEPEKDNLLFQICDASSKKLAVQTGDVFVGAGNEASFTLGTDKTTSYKEKIVGNSGVLGKAYLTEIKDKIYVTQSAEMDNCFYLPLDKAKPDDDVRIGYVYYSKARISNVIVMPSDLVISEVNKWNNNETYYYVWKVVDGVLVKQYITMDEALNTVLNVCVLGGLSDGDVVAKQIVEK